MDLEKKIKLIGRRRKEGKKEDIKKIKDNYFIHITKSKTKSGIRTIPLKNTFNFVFEELLLNTKEKEFFI